MKPAVRSLYIAAAAAVEAVSDGAPKKRIQLLPMGTIALRDGRGPFFLASKEAAHAVIEETRRRAGRQDIMIDYDHQSFYGATEGVGGQAPAAGWISPQSLVVESDGIWADVEWTDAAANKLTAREYRYLSPLFSYDPATMAVTAIRNAGLTNTPAIEELAAVASEKSNQEYLMDVSAIAVAAGLAASATPDEVAAHVAGLVKDAAALTAAGQKLGLDAGTTADQIVAAAARPNPAEFVPISVVQSLQADMAALKLALDDDKAETAVAAACAAGKVSPAMREWATGYARADLAGFEGYVATAPVIVAAGAQYPHLGGVPGDGSLTPDEKAVAATLGISAEQYLATKKGA